MPARTATPALVRNLILFPLLLALTMGVTTPAMAVDRAPATRPLATVPQRPSAPVRIALGDAEVQFTWRAVPGATGYRIRLTAYGKVVREQAWAAANIFIDGLDPETTYEFSVAAVNASGTGAYTAPVRFTTPFDFVERQFGADRYATAARVSFRAHPFHGIGAAYVTAGSDFPDALSAAAAAARAGAPVLLTRPTGLPDPTRKELGALRPSQTVVVGGPGAVSETVERQIGSIVGGAPRRLSGVDRFATAADVSALWPSAPVVYLADGMNFPDALAGAAAAGSTGAPVLLTRRATLPEATASALARLRPSKIVVLGGTGVVSDETAALAAAATGVATTVQRLSGADRYATAVAVSQATFPRAGVPVVYVASGQAFPDALAGAAAAGRRGGPVLLTPQAALPTTVLAELRRLQPKRVVVLGGPSVVSDTVIAQLLPLAP